jgi:protein-disulfide isomerase
MWRETRGFPVSTTRREFLHGAAAVGLLSALAAGGAPAELFGLLRPAFAQAPPTEELMKAGPLGEMAQGNAEAPVTIIEYASMTCSHCAEFAVHTLPEVKSRYVDKGKVRYIMREFPLDPVAAAGFMLARCAGEDKYFDVIDLLFHQQAEWAFVKQPLPALLNMAKQIGLDEQHFNECLANQKLLDGIEWVRSRGAEKFGVNSTPTFFINGKIQRGAMPIDEMAKLIEP